eukprot:TRINITY_DN2223_c0_g1_i38.p1 TRINITY_DN2223_c0_g1~~TRINITY_DN2223_c0_g1_i38.p1  ORF type:complete len:189 (+),score=26.95 TRINITY_DN2223_c0_g1_i38:1323-1889(+)
MKILFKKVILDFHDDFDNDILSIDNSDPLHPSVKTSRVFVVFKYVPIFLFIPEFAPTYKWCHFMRVCSYCGLAGRLVPACPARSIFITTDIWTISHTDPNPSPFFIDEIYEGDVVIPDSFSLSPPQPDHLPEEEIVSDTPDCHTPSIEVPPPNSSTFDTQDLQPSQVDTMAMHVQTHSSVTREFTHNV